MEINLTGTWRCAEDNGLYDIRQFTDGANNQFILWYAHGKAHDRTWANVTKGILTSTTIVDHDGKKVKAIVNTDWADVPSAENRGNGHLSLYVYDNDNMVKDTQRSNYWGSTWTRVKKKAN